MLTPELTPCLRAHTFSFYADAYAGLRTPGFCLREVRIASPLLKMDNCVLNVIGIPAMELPTIRDMYRYVSSSCVSSSCVGNPSRGSRGSVPASGRSCRHWIRYLVAKSSPSQLKIVRATARGVMLSKKLDAWQRCLDNKKRPKARHAVLGQHISFWCQEYSHKISHLREEIREVGRLGTNYSIENL